MKSFLQNYAEDVTGVLSGFDRLVLRGTLRVLAVTGGVMSFLNAVGVTLRDFGDYVDQTTRRLKEASCEQARQLQRPIRYLESSQLRKETVARDVAQADGITDGLICILSCVEPCISYKLRHAKDGRWWLQRARRKCLHLYHYWVDKRFGFMSARIQTWFPFSIQVCLNGREWLAQQMDRRGLSYERRENCFVHLSDVEAAQNLMAQQLRISWSTAMGAVAHRLNPIHAEIFERYPINYYWSVHQSEWATDILFRSPAHLAKIFPLLVRGSIASFSSPDVMRFLGKKPHGNNQGSVISDYLKRAEGIRVKHRMNTNSTKMYNKQPNLLRLETTINDPSDFKVYRSSSWDPEGPLDWRPLRKGIADIHRRAEVSQKSNERYADALASLSTNMPLGEIMMSLCRPVTWKGHRVRALRPWSKDDLELLEAINKGEFALNGFRNRDICGTLFGPLHSSPQGRRRASARITRRFRMLRAHGIISKVPRTHRYVLTEKGRKMTVAILQCRNVTLDQLNKAAA